MEPRFFQVGHGRGLEEIFIFRCCNDSLALLCHTVRIEESPCQVDDGLIAPMHNQPFRIRGYGNDGSFQVFFSCVFHEFIYVFRCDDDSHAFLRFGNG